MSTAAPHQTASHPARPAAGRAATASRPTAAEQARLEHHEEDAGKRQGDGQEGGFEATEAVVGRRLDFGHYIINFSTFIVHFERSASQSRIMLQFCHGTTEMA